MGSLVTADQVDDSLFLPFDDDDDDALDDLVLMDLDNSSEDAVLAYALSSDNGNDFSHPTALSNAEHHVVVHHQHHHQRPSQDPTTGAQPPSAAPRLLACKLRGGKLNKATLKANPNKARDERKGELIYLRKKVAELEDQHASLRARRPRITTVPATSKDATITPTTALCASCDATQPGGRCSHAPQSPPLPLTVLNVWEDIASRQSEERVKAERENIRLKLVIENQLKVAQSLEKILNKKATTKVRRGWLLIKRRAWEWFLTLCSQDIDEFVERNQMSAPTADATDADVFKELLEGVEQSYAEIDVVFEANGLAHTETPVSHARVRSDPTTTGGMFLEIFANQILPFDMHATASAVWHHFTFAKEKTPFRGYSYNSSKVRRVVFGGFS